MVLLKLALRPIRQAPVSSVLTAAALGMIAFSASVLTWSMTAMDPILARLETDQVVTAYLASGLQESQERAVVDSIRVLVGSSRVDWVQTEGFLEQIESAFPKLKQELLELGDELRSVIPRYVSIAGNLSEKNIEDLRRLDGIESVENSSHRYQAVIGAFRVTESVMQLFLIGLLMVAWVLVAHLARTHQMSLQDSMVILRQWGASSFQEKLPQMGSILIVSSMGAAICLVLWFGFASIVRHTWMGLSPVFEALPDPHWLLSAGGAGVLIVLSLLGSAFHATWVRR